MTREPLCVVLFGLLIAACGDDDDSTDAAIDVSPDVSPDVAADAPRDVSEDRVADADGSADADASPPSGGRFHAQWSIEQGGRAASCEAVGATNVKLRSVRQGTTDAVEDTLACDDAMGTTAPHPAGLYTVTYSLLDDADVVLAEDEPVSNQLLVAGETTELAPARFEIELPIRTLTFDVRFHEDAAVTSNCGSYALGGAGVEEQVILVSTAGSCTPVSIGGDVTDIALTCSGYACQERSVTHRLELPAGLYTLEVFGRRRTPSASTVTCYQVAPITVDLRAADVGLDTVVVPFAPASEDMAACTAT